MVFLSTDLISSHGVRLLGTGGASTEIDQGKGIPGRIGLLDTGSQNQDQGCQLMQGLSRNPQDLLQEDPAKGHILKECQRCTQGPGPSLTPEEDLFQDQLHHLLQGKKQGIPGDVYCEFDLNYRFQTSLLRPRPSSKTTQPSWEREEIARRNQELYLSR